MGSPNNPCGIDCTKLNTFDLEGNTVHNYSIALPSKIGAASMNFFNIEFVTGWNITPPGNIGYGNDKWDLAAIAACMSYGTKPFISDGHTVGAVATPVGTLKSFQANNYGLPGIFWQPPSFKGAFPLSSGMLLACKDNGNFNPPPNGDVPSSIMSGEGAQAF